MEDSAHTNATQDRTALLPYPHLLGTSGPRACPPGVLSEGERPEPWEPSGTLPASVVGAGGPAGQVSTAPLEAAVAAASRTAAGLDFLRMAPRLKRVRPAPFILGAGDRRRRAVREKPQGPRCSSCSGGDRAPREAPPPRPLHRSCGLSPPLPFPASTCPDASSLPSALPRTNCPAAVGRGVPSA